MSDQCSPTVRPRPAAALLLVGCLVGVGVGSATAQPAEPWLGRVEIAVGEAFVGGFSIGASEASLTENARIDPGRVRLFATESALDSSAAFEGRLGVRLSSALSVEGRFAYARPGVTTRISGDLEGGTPVTLTSSLSQYVVDVGLVVHLTGLAARDGRLVPFVVGGAGYLRQLHEGAILASSGAVIHAGGGVRYLLTSSPRGRLKGVGLRGDVQVQIQRHGFDFEGRVRQAFSGGASVFLVF